jgi:hypothetical protein
MEMMNEYTQLLAIMLDVFNTKLKHLDNYTLKRIKFYSRELMKSILTLSDPGDSTEYPSISKLKDDIINYFHHKGVKLSNKDINKLVKLVGELSSAHNRNALMIEKLPTDFPIYTVNPEPELFLKEISNEIVFISEDEKYFSDLKKNSSNKKFDKTSENELVFEEMCKYI